VESGSLLGSFSPRGQKFAEHEYGKPRARCGANVESVRPSCQSRVSGCPSSRSSPAVTSLGHGSV